MDNCNDFPAETSAFGACGDPCAGGFSEMILIAYAEKAHDLVKLGKANVLTCKSSANGSPCASGCMPYTAGVCSGPAGGVVNPQGLATDPPGCTNLYLSDELCDTNSVTVEDLSQVTELNNRIKSWIPMLSSIDSTYSALYNPVVDVGYGAPGEYAVCVCVCFRFPLELSCASG